jgi:hypothetical protein
VLRLMWRSLALTFPFVWAIPRDYADSRAWCAVQRVQSSRLRILHPGASTKKRILDAIISVRPTSQIPTVGA